MEISKRHSLSHTGHFDGMEIQMEAKELKVCSDYCIIPLQSVWVTKQLAAFLEDSTPRVQISLRTEPGYHRGMNRARAFGRRNEGQTGLIAALGDLLGLSKAMRRSQTINKSLPLHLI